MFQVQTCFETARAVWLPKLLSLQNICASLYSYICSLEFTIDCERKWCHFCLKDICGPKVNNRGKILILFKHRFVKIILFWDVSGNRWKYFSVITFCWVNWQKTIFYEVWPFCLLSILVSLLFLTLNFQILSVSVFCLKKSSFLFQEFVVDRSDF